MKVGTVVAVVKPFQCPLEDFFAYEKKNPQARHEGLPQTGRDHFTYLVAVAPQTPKGVITQVYWPRVSLLKEKPVRSKKTSGIRKTAKKR